MTIRNLKMVPDQDNTLKVMQKSLKDIEENHVRGNDRLI